MTHGNNVPEFFSWKKFEKSRPPLKDYTTLTSRWIFFEGCMCMGKSISFMSSNPPVLLWDISNNDPCVEEVHWSSLPGKMKPHPRNFLYFRCNLTTDLNYPPQSKGLLLENWSLFKDLKKVSVEYLLSCFSPLWLGTFHLLFHRIYDCLKNAIRCIF